LADFKPEGDQKYPDRQASQSVKEPMAREGKTSTANFISGLYQAVSPLLEVFKMAGPELLLYSGETQKNEEDKKSDIAVGKLVPKK
jgi:hypothetical protein